MTTPPVPGPGASAGTRSAEISAELLAFLSRRLRTDVGPGQDLFGTGLVTSLFALELVVHLEQTFRIAVEGPELTLANFRTVDAMTRMVLRLDVPDRG
ncbi:acyl carrier protein [Actinokineospora sp. 24-640]